MILEKLPPTALNKILENLDEPSLCALLQTNRFFNQMPEKLSDYANQIGLNYFKHITPYRNFCKILKDGSLKPRYTSGNDQVMGGNGCYIYLDGAKDIDQKVDASRIRDEKNKKSKIRFDYIRLFSKGVQKDIQNTEFILLFSNKILDIHPSWVLNPTWDYGRIKKDTSGIKSKGEVINFITIRKILNQSTREATRTSLNNFEFCIEGVLDLNKFLLAIIPKAEINENFKKNLIGNLGKDIFDQYKRYFMPAEKFPNKTEIDSFFNQIQQDNSNNSEDFDYKPK